MVVLWFLVFCLAFTLSKSAILDEPRALLRFKSSVTDDPLKALQGWNLSTTHCSWNGVRCGNSTNRVVALSLPFSQLSGEIPAAIGDLEFLEALELQGNNFSGQIPDQISSLQSLGLLNLSFNSVSGSVPEELIGNGKLRVVDLSNNMLSGSISISISTGCEFLIHLKLSNNVLVGNIPPEIGECKNLRTLLIDGNILEGTIPSELGQISELRVLDVSRNSLTQRIPVELANCKKLSVVVLTNLLDMGTDNKVSSVDSFTGEFNAFEGVVPYELLQLPSLQVLWAPRANLGGRLPANWGDSCSLRILNLGGNYVDGAIPETIGMCKNLAFLDLSSNNLVGYLPWQLQVSCMVYFNVSKNNISGVIPRFGEGPCDGRMISFSDTASYLNLEDTQIAFSNIPMLSSRMRSMVDQGFSILHDLSWNRFSGPLPSFSIGDRLLSKSELSYKLSLDNNLLNGSFSMSLVSECDKLQSVSVNLSANQIGGDLQEALVDACVRLKEFEAAQNRIFGSIGPGIDKLVLLQKLDLRGNRIIGSLPCGLSRLKNLTWLLLGGNNLTGKIPSDLGQLASLKALDLSDNVLTGSIPISLANATKIETLLLNSNRLSGEIPASFSHLASLTSLDVSFNNLSGHVPSLKHPSDCATFRGNKFLHACSDDPKPAAPNKLMFPLVVPERNHQKKLKSFIVATVAFCSAIICMVVVVVLIAVFRKQNSTSRHDSHRGKVVVTFADAPAGLNYENVVRSTGGFGISNLIGTGGFGSTYKAELAPGYHVAVKRLSIGRFHGVKQFDAEIRTLGRIRHKNLVTLIGYYVGETEMFLVYNYLSGGNLQSFIQDKSGKKVQWSVIYKIVMDVAHAIAYLHYSCDPRIVHRDIKPSNILLDDKLSAYLSDFGLARLLGVSETHATTDVAGTFGYVAPEYATTCRVSDKADVYSFGVVLLELLSGKKSLDPSFSEYGNGFNIVEWTKLLMREGRFSEVLCPELWETGPKESLIGVLKLASTCTLETLSVRPTMKQVLDKLKHLRP